MPSPTLTRRALLAGAGATIASVAIAAPYVSTAHSQEVCSLPGLAETITDRLDRLTSGLAEALAEYQGGKFKVVVEPDGDVHFERLIAPAQERRDRHLAEYKRACEELDPMIRQWTDLTHTAACGGGTISYRISGRYVGDGIYESGRDNALGGRIQWKVTLRPGDVIDGERTFYVACPGERSTLLESRLETFIGRRIA